MKESIEFLLSMELVMLKRIFNYFIFNKKIKLALGIFSNANLYISDLELISSEK